MRLRVTELATGYGGVAVVAGLSLEVAAGEAVLLAGPNGSGKSTLLRTIAGFITPLRGSIELEDGDPELTVGQQAHLLGHLNAIKPRLTVRQNLEDWARILGGSSSAVEAALAAFALDDLAELPLGYLSAGQKRRTALARLLVAHRPLWLLDEPTTALDTANADLVARIMRAHVAAGGIIVAATHLALAIPASRTLDLASLREGRQ